MQSIEGNRIATCINPVPCFSGTDAIAAAAAVRARRKSLFFVAQAPRIAEVAQPVKVEEPKVVPPIETTLAEKFMGPIEEVHGLGRIPSLEDIKVAVCNFYQVRALDLLSARRTQDICIPRQVAMWFARRTTLQTYPAIGRYFGGRDHTTAINSFARTEERMSAGHDVKRHVAAIADALRAKGFTLDIDA